MIPESKERFLIAIAKMLGEAPHPQKPLDGIIVCEEWHLEELLALIIKPPDELQLTLENFNRLMINCGRRIVTPHFFKYFFKSVRTIADFEAAVDRYRIKAMWLFGNFRFGYRKIATSSDNDFNKLIGETTKIDPSVFAEREPFVDITPIPVDDLDLLGYVSRDALKDLDMAREALEQLTVASSQEEFLTRLGPEKQSKISNVLSGKGIEFPATGSANLTTTSITDKRNQASKIVSDLTKRQQEAIRIGKENTHRYLTLPHLDVYVATSMRNPIDFRLQHEFTKAVFENALISSLKLRFFDPTLSYEDDRITKGIIEMLMLKRARVTIYNAGDSDTLGKDAELAATLAQGKAVIVYVPESMPGVPSSKLDRRAQTFKADHPLGLQIDLRTGVAHGIIVVRSADECAKMLRKVMLREREFTIRHEGGNYLLVEKETGSVVRVVSDDPFLTHAFWTYFHAERN